MPGMREPISRNGAGLVMSTPTPPEDDGYIGDSLEELLATKTRGTPCKVVASREEYEAYLRGPQTETTGQIVRKPPPAGS